MNQNSNHKFSEGERNLFKSIADHVQANPNYYKEAGEWLDEYCSESTYWLRQDNKLEELKKKHTQFPVLADHKKIENLKNRIKERRTPALLKRFQEARNYLLDKYGDENFLSKEIAAKVIIITWLLTDPDTEKKKVGITELETWPWEPIDDVLKMTRSYAAFLFAQNKDAWMRLVCIGWNGITASETKAAPKDKGESTETEREGFVPHKIKLMEQVIIELGEWEKKYLPENTQDGKVKLIDIVEGELLKKIIKWLQWNKHQSEAEELKAECTKVLKWFSAEDGVFSKNLDDNPFEADEKGVRLQLTGLLQNIEENIKADSAHKKSAETRQESLQKIIEVLKNWQKSEKTDKDFEAAKLALPPIAKTYEILCRSKDQCGAKTTDVINWLGSAANDRSGYCRAMLDKLASPEVITDLETWQEKPAETEPEKGKGKKFYKTWQFWTIIAIIAAAVISPIVSHFLSDKPADKQFGIPKTETKTINETENALHKPIVVASANVEVTIESDEDIDGIHHARAYLVFGKGEKSLLKTSSIGYEARQRGNGNVIYKGKFEMDATDSAAGRPVSFLKDAEFIQIQFGRMPSDSFVLEGDAVCIINNSVRLEFSIPPQKLVNNRIFIRNLSESLRVFNELEN